MKRYIARRILHMLPTLAGVLFVTFLLFHVVGGSPGVLVLGEHASAEALDEFDRARGFDLPLFFGRRIRTRAWPDTTFQDGPGPFASGTATWNEGEAGMQWTQTGTFRLPTVYAVSKNDTWEWRLRYRRTGEGEVMWNGQPLPRTDRPTTLRLQAPVGEWTGELQVDDPTFTLYAAELRRLQTSPLHSQFTHYLGRLARLDLGVSTATHQRVADMIKEGIGPSLALMLPIFFGTLGLSLSLALVCAAFRHSSIDRVLVALAVALMSVNYIVWIVLGQYLLAYRWGLFPVWGFESWAHLALPALIGIVSGLGANLRFYRTLALDEMYRDYVRTARAKGASRARALFRHVLPNMMLPLLTHVITAIPFLYTGSLLLESFFGIPGLGYLSVNAINSADFDVIQAVVLIGALLFMGANLLTDLCYAWADPRVRVS